VPPSPGHPTAKSSDQQGRYDTATQDIEPPVAIVDRTAFDANAADLVRRAAGKPLRVASKSLRCRSLLARALGHDGWSGIMAYSLPEALWLARAGAADDILVAYPTTHRQALAELAADAHAAATITLMVDDLAHLDLIESTTRKGRQIRLCLDLDASWRPIAGVHLGARRSPVHSPEQAGALAATIADRPGLRLVGVMSYEAQIAGMGDAPPGRPVRGAVIRAVQAGSYPELLARRTAAVAAVRRHADLEFVNGGGTGSVAGTAADPSVTEITAGSGLLGPTLFDAYRAWRPLPAALFALAVVRKPTPRTATVLGGGWVASGPADRDRLPTPWLPAGLRLVRGEGAGEVQTPLTGPGAAALRVGDRVWFRHAKAGELAEHVNTLYLVDGSEVLDAFPTYRGEGHAFLG
jgi:D-serine deaminase-like pyridoxal phosphate-dependent protein